MKISIILGSKSDIEVQNSIPKVLDEFNIEYEAKVISAHRNPQELDNYVKTIVNCEIVKSNSLPLSKISLICIS